MRLDLRSSVRVSRCSKTIDSVSDFKVSISDIALSADPLLIWNYGTMGVLAALAGIVFWFTFRHLDREEDALNELAEGRVNADGLAPVHRSEKGAGIDHVDGNEA